jgi:flagellar basal-body rod modification protein FlgD
MSSINSNFKIGNTSNNGISTKRDIVDKDVFLKILTVELTHQDPLNAKDNTEYISQLAQFTALEQSQNLNTSISKMLLSQKITQGSVLIGHEVSFKVDDDKVVKDVVKGVKVEGQEVYLTTVSGEKYKIDSVLEVEPVSNGKQSQAGEV